MSINDAQEIYSHLVEKIKVVRKRKKIKQSELAKKLNISQSTYSDMERGAHRFDAIRLFAVLQILEINPFENEKETELSVVGTELDILEKFNRQEESINEIKANIKEIFKIIKNKEE